MRLPQLHISSIDNRAPFLAMCLHTRSCFNNHQTMKCYECLGAAAIHGFGPTQPTNWTRGLQRVFLGYSLTQSAYMCLDKSTGRIYTSRHVQFDEETFPFSQETKSRKPNDETPAPSYPSQTQATSVPFSLPPSPLVSAPSLPPLTSDPHQSSSSSSINNGDNDVLSSGNISNELEIILQNFQVLHRISLYRILPQTHHPKHKPKLTLYLPPLQMSNSSHNLQSFPYQKTPIPCELEPKIT